MYGEVSGLRSVIKRLSSKYKLEVSMENIATVTLYCYVPVDVLEEDLVSVLQYHNTISKAGKLNTTFKVDLNDLNCT